MPGDGENASLNRGPGPDSVANQHRSFLAAVPSLPIDIAKYCLPESYKTELTWSINARSLQNFISLRSSKSALWEIQNLANAIYAALPDEHKFIFDECVYKAK